MKKAIIKWVDNPSNNDAPRIKLFEKNVKIDAPNDSDRDKFKRNLYHIIRYVLLKAENRIDILQTGIGENLSIKQIKTLVGRIIFELPANVVIGNGNVIEFSDTYEVHLSLYPRIDKEDEYDSIKPYVLIYMLKHVLPDIFIPDSDAESTIGEDDALWKYLSVYQFKKLLIELNQLGFYSSYVKIKKNDERVRGSIDFPRHIKLNLGQKNGKIAYSYRKKTTDNPLNQLILRTYELLKKKLPNTAIEDNQAFMSIISELKYQAPGYSSISDDAVVKQNLKPMTHPYYLKYDSMRKLCLNIFRNTDSAIGVETDDEYKVRGYLINMNQLFEDFVKKAILDKCFSNMSVEDQYEISLSNGKLKHEKYDVNNPPNEGTIRPDFVVSSEQSVIVFDAKNKPALYDNLAINENNDDYMRRIGKDVNKLIGDTAIVNVLKYYNDRVIEDTKEKSAKELRKKVIANLYSYTALPEKMYSAIISPIQESGENCITSLGSCIIDNKVINKKTEVATDLIRIPFPSKGDQNYADWEKKAEDLAKGKENEEGYITRIRNYYEGLLLMHN